MVTVLGVLVLAALLIGVGVLIRSVLPAGLLMALTPLCLFLGLLLHLLSDRLPPGRDRPVAVGAFLAFMLAAAGVAAVFLDYAMHRFHIGL